MTPIRVRDYGRDDAPRADGAGGRQCELHRRDRRTRIFFGDQTEENFQNAQGCALLAALAALGFARRRLAS